MSAEPKPLDRLIHDLRERAKELNCLYEVQELLGSQGLGLDEICRGIIAVLPPGWQYPDVCQAEIRYNGGIFQTAGYAETPWVQSSDVIVQDEIVGTISVCYTEERPQSDEGPFLKEERKLINTIAEQLGFYILHEKLRQVFRQQQAEEGSRRAEWNVILDLLKRTDTDLLMRISRKMIQYLAGNGAKGAEQLLDQFALIHAAEDDEDENRPYRKGPASSILEVCDKVFELAGGNMADEAILDNIQKWTREDRVGFLVGVLGDPNSTLADVSQAMERYRLLAEQGLELTPSRERWFRVALIRRLLSDDPHFIQAAQGCIALNDLSDLMRRVIFPPNSHGKLGGKGSGLFLAAQILRRAAERDPLLQNIRMPKTWYITSDSFFYFMHYNGLDDIVAQKYETLSQIKREYPYIVHLFKSSNVPPEIVKALSLALDDFGNAPLIVRSSSLLEDQAGAAFAGKYRSLFIANQGSKEERMIELMDAVAEVFASMFGPDPIEYRIRHRLVDRHEEMGILIQEVVGSRVGAYHLPAFAGVAFSQNEFPWSGRIRREDGLVRLVPGLGTRAVDRIGDDYPVLVAPGRPNLRVNVTPEEVLHYSPKKLDAINLEARKFETIEIRQLLRDAGPGYPIVNQIFSVITPDGIRPARGTSAKDEGESLVTTFDGLFAQSRFLSQMVAILRALSDYLGYPVDIEFAHDGRDFYLLQCRAQSYREDSQPASIPRDLSPEKILFSARRYITNGSILNITHLVYVDSHEYSRLNQYEDMQAVARAIGELNKILPPRQFILIGPGRWGSRGDIKLGVNVTYSDIDHTAMLVEVACPQDGYGPEPSFGTHFFQDLVEASIRYLPIYPDEAGIIFNRDFLHSRPNTLANILPEFANLVQVIHVIDLPSSTGGRALQILMNADEGLAVAILD